MKIAYDFHIHSCLSLCAEDESTPASIAGMAYLAGLNAFSIADHQSAKNCVAAAKAAAQYGLTFVPALELNTSEEVHILCLFSCVDNALEFSEYITSKLMVAPKRSKHLWRQWVMDENDNVLYQEEPWLGSSADIGVYDCAKLVDSYGGLAIPAHIDRPSTSLLSNLGFYDSEMGFSVCEVTNDCNIPQLLKDHPELKGMRFIRNSDAHEITSIPDAKNYIDVEENTPRGIIEALKKRHKEM